MENKKDYFCFQDPVLLSLSPAFRLSRPIFYELYNFFFLCLFSRVLHDSTTRFVCPLVRPLP